MRAFLECQYESGRGHHSMKNKIYLVFDKTKASLKIKNFLIKKIETTALKKSNIIEIKPINGGLQLLQQYFSKVN